MKSTQIKKSEIEKRIKSQMVGLIVRWNDPDPLNSTARLVDTELTHRNRIRKLSAGGIYRNFQKFCVHVRMYYLVTMTVVFKYDNGVNADVVREIEAFCLISEIEQLSIDLIEAAMREGDKSKFSHVRFEVECLSSVAPAKTIEQKLIEKLEAQYEI